MGIGSMKKGFYPLHTGGGGGGGGVVTGGFTGVAVDPATVSINFRYALSGGVVTLWIDTVPGTLTGTSTVNTFSFAGGTLPVEIRPGANRADIALVTDDNVGKFGRVTVGTTGSLTFSLGVVSGTALTLSATGFTPTGVKGLPANWIFVYPI